MSQLWNHVPLTEEHAKPIVGEGATYLSYTDRHAYTITAVDPKGKWFDMTRDKAERADSHGMSESQDYTFTTNPNAKPIRVRMSKKGWRIGGMKGNKVLVGVRDEYYDYSF